MKEMLSKTFDRKQTTQNILVNFEKLFKNYFKKEII